MTSRRVLKVAEAIRETVSLAILTELRDPRVRDVTVTFVEVSADLRHAKVHISVMGDDRKTALVLHGLDAAAGFLQRKIADRLDTRYIPRLKFEIDKGVKHSLAVARILEEVLPEATTQGAPTSDAEPVANDDDEFADDELSGDELADESDSDDELSDELETDDDDDDATPGRRLDS